MKKHFILIILFCFCLGATNAQERTVLSFNQDWAFKKAPASSELIQNMQTWGNGWQPVELPHTWNAKDMQVKANNFYEGVGYYKKTYFFRKSWQRNACFSVLKELVPVRKCLLTANWRRLTVGLMRLLLVRSANS